ncbi:MAG TPA: hypothetical protein DCY79_14825 [Planctomycetaceae bacterium]|nr:hypothetical protein [Blastopirellula sp.]HAY81077.1 hypothetical protein [Planctomycetaceae bacterium]
MQFQLPSKQRILALAIALCASLLAIACAQVRNPSTPSDTPLPPKARTQSATPAKPALAANKKAHRFPDTAMEYAKLIESELGVPPHIDLAKAVEIPIYVNGKKALGEFSRCDNPTLLGGKTTLSGSMIQRYPGRTADGSSLPDVIWIAFARRGPDSFRGIGSVQMIGYHKKTGATAFFESCDALQPWVTVDPETTCMTGVMPSIDQPDAFNRAFRVPGVVQCVQCHQNDPFITDSFINAAKIPGTEETVVPALGRDAPYYVIGGENWDMRTLHIQGNGCLECHRIGMGTLELFMSTGWDPNQHMPPNDPGSLKADLQELLEAWKRGPHNVANAQWLIPPARGTPEHFVGQDYPYQASFNRPRGPNRTIRKSDEAALEQLATQLKALVKEGKLSKQDATELYHAASQKQKQIDNE